MSIFIWRVERGINEGNMGLALVTSFSLDVWEKLKFLALLWSKANGLFLEYLLGDLCRSG